MGSGQCWAWMAPTPVCASTRRLTAPAGLSVVGSDPWDVAYPLCPFPFGWMQPTAGSHHSVVPALSQGCPVPDLGQITRPCENQTRKTNTSSPLYYWTSPCFSTTTPLQQARQPAAGIAARCWLGKGDALQIVLLYMVLLLEIKILFGDSTITVFFLKTDLNWEDHKSWAVDLLMHFKKASI